MYPRLTSVLLNLGHTLDHLILLIFATAVASIATEFGLARWEDLMPYGAPAFFFFGLGSLPSGKLGDLWGRRPMMLLYFAGIGISSLLVSQAQNPLQLSLLLSLMGCFASIYHPVGIPMLIQHSTTPGRAIGINGMMGNMGIAAAALLTGWVVKDFGWRAAFWIPGVCSLVLGVVFWRVSDTHAIAPAKKNTSPALDFHNDKLTLFFVMTLAATTGSFLFNFTTNGNNEILFSKLGDELRDPAVIGMLLAAVYFIASFSQLIIGNLIDRVPLKKLYSRVIFLQLLAIVAATQLDGWSFYFAQLIFMCAIFAAIPFTDAMIARYVDDSMRSRFSGARLTISFGVSSMAVWLIGPVVKAWGFSTFLWLMAATSAATFVVIWFLPDAIES
jgi:MFS family permease